MPDLRVGDDLVAIATTPTGAAGHGRPSRVLSLRLAVDDDLRLGALSVAAGVSKGEIAASILKHALAKTREAA